MWYVLTVGANIVTACYSHSNFFFLRLLDEIVAGCHMLFICTCLKVEM